MASTYTRSQLEAYLQRIGYANSASGVECPRLHQLQASIQQDALKALEELQRRHISSIPWGNSAIHYSQHHSISTYPSAVFEKLVVRRLDGYCMENTNLLYVVLRSLGYQAYPAAGRVSNAAADPENAGSEVRYGSLGHMVIIVGISNQKYLVDVGFGNNGPTSPLPLLRNVSADLIPPAQMKLDKTPLPEAVDQSQEFWVYSVRYGPDKEWAPMYAFSETEFLPQDFAMMNFNTSKGSSSWFTQRVVCVRHILGDDESSIKGLYVMAGKQVKRRVHGQTEIVQTLENEDDRVEALAKWFGIHLLDHEVAGIQGLVSELK
ncbi:arylamine N-acetyltransferase family protein [Aspergillus foveolatus]|uniref:arylamine N-acetyltransferase family protein n=1 Tax=Aspergillus foveolatus TaxID=210207 RepID=UPI003CCE13C0